MSSVKRHHDSFGDDSREKMPWSSQIDRNYIEERYADLDIDPVVLFKNNEERRRIESLSQIRFEQELRIRLQNYENERTGGLYSNRENRDRDGDGYGDEARRDGMEYQRAYEKKQRENNALEYLKRKRNRDWYDGNEARSRSGSPQESRGHHRDHDRQHHGSFPSRGGDEPTSRSGRDRQTGEGSRKHARQEISPDTDEGDATRHKTLFTDDRDGVVDNPPSNRQARRLEKVSAQISTHVMNDVRVTAEQLLNILEHPRMESYLKGAFVRLSAHCATSAGCRYSPARIQKIERLTHPYSLGGERQKECHYLLDVVFLCERQETPSSHFARDDVDIHSSTVRVTDIEDAPFTDAEIAEWRQLVPAMTRLEDFDRLEAVPIVLREKSKQLRNFTFTDEDVKEILESREALSERDLYIRKADLELELSQLNSRLSSHTKVSTSRLYADRQKANEIENELARLNGSIARLKAESARPSAAPPGGSVSGTSRERPGRDATQAISPTTKLAGHDECLHPSLVSGVLPSWTGTASPLKQNTRNTAPTSLASSISDPYSRRECRPTQMWSTKPEPAPIASAQPDGTPRSAANTPRRQSAAGAAGGGTPQAGKTMAPHFKHGEQLNIMKDLLLVNSEINTKLLPVIKDILSRPANNEPSLPPLLGKANDAESKSEKTLTLSEYLSRTT